MPSVEQARDASRRDDSDRRSMETPSLIELEESIKETSTRKRYLHEPSLNLSSTIACYKG